jgi:[FeFe] hydrogenase H-cluster maturation GTPase HydF
MQRKKMEKTPKSMRMQIGIFGRTNVGKSSFLNMIAGQDVAVTSEIPGTTTDIVEKAMELLPVGPVLFLDTAGIDDISALAEKRLAKTEKVFDRADVFVLIAEPNRWTRFEDSIIKAARKRKANAVIVINKADIEVPAPGFVAECGGRSPYVMGCASTNPAARDTYVVEFKALLMKACPDEKSMPLIGDLLPENGLAVLIIPIDKEAPKGRIILPQVQAIRDALDHGAAALVVREHEYPALLKRLASPPDLVVCDSQVVDAMVANTPLNVPCTTFSILLSRCKGDLEVQAAGAAAIESLEDGDRVLIAEACTHHAVVDDIGRVKIPKWLKKFTGATLKIDVVSGRDYPANLKEYKLVVLCGSCMLTRRETLSRVRAAAEAGVAVTNYGLCISFLQGVIERVLEPFPAALEALKHGRVNKGKAL